MDTDYHFCFINSQTDSRNNIKYTKYITGTAAYPNFDWNDADTYTISGPLGGHDTDGSGTIHIKHEKVFINTTNKAELLTVRSVTGGTVIRSATIMGFNGTAGTDTNTADTDLPASVSFDDGGGAHDYAVTAIGINAFKGTAGIENNVGLATVILTANTTY